MRVHRTFFGGGSHRRAERNRNRIGNMLGQLPEKPSAFEAEHAAPQAIEMHRNHGNGLSIESQSIQNLFHAVLERQQIPRPAYGAFGENADDVALLQLL